MAQLDGVIAKLVDKDGEVKFPVTSTKAVETSDGRNLEEIVEIVDNMPNITTGIANTVFDTRIVEVNTEMQKLKQLNTVVGNNTRDINTIQNQLTQHLGENSNSFLTIDNNINEIRGIISVQGTSLEEQKIRITDIEDALPNKKEIIDSAEAELANPYTIVKRNANGEVMTNTAFRYSDNTSIRHISESLRIEWGNSTGWYTIHDQETLPTEKGTWTPYCYCDYDGAQISLSNANGTYSRVGDIVLIQGRVTGIMPETSQGAFRVGGLPYVCRGSNTGVTIAYSKGIYTGNGYQLYARIESGSSTIMLVSGSIANNSVGGSLITNEQVANFDLMFSATIKLTNEY
jgi:hypothetical protein